MLLEQNYRSTQNILSAANAVISHNFDRKDKKLWTDVGAGEKIVGFTGYSQHDEAQFVADEVDTLRRGGVDYSQMAVFYRTNSQSRALEEIFIRSAVPYKIMGGTKFYERAEIKDALAYLVAVSNPADEMAMRRIINRPRRGIGDVTIETISRYAQDQQITFRDALANSSALGVGPKIQAAIAHLDAVLAEATDLMLPATGELAPPTAVAEGLQLLLGKTGLHRCAAREPRPAGRGARREPRRARRRRPRVRAQQPRGHGHRLPRRGGAGLGCRRPRRCVGLGVAHDDAHRQGPRVRRRVRHRRRRGPHPAPDLGGRARRAAGGATPLLRRHHARAQAPVPVARDDPRAVRRGVGRDAEPVPAGDPARAAALAPVARRRQLARRHAVARAERAAAGRAGSAGSGGGSRYGDDLVPKSTSIEKFANRIPAKVRDNGDLVLAPGDRIRHDDFGEGRVDAVTGEGAKRIAHVRFDTVGAEEAADQDRADREAIANMVAANCQQLVSLSDCRGRQGPTFHAILGWTMPFVLRHASARLIAAMLAAVIVASGVVAVGIPAHAEDRAVVAESDGLVVETQTAVLSGFVTDELGQPIAGALVTIARVGLGSDAAYTDVSGAWSFGGLAAADYVVSFSLTRGGETVTEYWDGAADVASATVIPLSNGELRTDISVILTWPTPSVIDSATPTVTGTPRVGETLTAVPEGWSDGATFTYQWLVDGEPVSVRSRRLSLSHRSTRAS